MAVQITTLRVYGVALEVVRAAHSVGLSLPGYLADQMQRAAASVVLNLAEGYGRTGAKDRRKFFVTARASAHEVYAIADVAGALGLADAASIGVLRDRCDHVSALLYRFR